MWSQEINPLGNITFSALVAGIPIVALFVMLLSRKVKGHIACFLTLFLALVMAVTVYGMPWQLAGMAALYGMLSGIFPIAWIVLNAVFLYNISVKTGSFEIVRSSVESVTPDRRIQALLIAFCFGAFLEGAAGFGAPVAITAGMLVGLGFEPLYAAGICLISNTAPVAFGGIGIAVITAGHLTNIDPNLLSRMISHQLPFVALIIPLWLVVIISGWRGAKEVLPAIIVTGASYAGTMFLVAHFLGPTLPDVLSAVVSIGCLIVFLKFWQPKNIWRFPKERHQETTHHKLQKYSVRQLLKAWTPFILLVVFVGNWGMTGTQFALNTVSIKIPFGILNHAILTNGKTLPVIYTFGFLSAAGTAILFAALLSALFLRMNIKDLVLTFVSTIKELMKPLVTISSIVGFAYVLNFSGMATAIGNSLTVIGGIFPLVSPFLGWLGVFITGSDTSSNALFSSIQSQTAKSLGISPVLTVAANSSGGVAAKMISPQSIAVASAATKLSGQEGKLFRFTILHSLGLITIICAISYIQAYHATWMIPENIQEQVLNASTALTPVEIGILVLSIFIIISLFLISLGKGRQQV